MSSTSDSDVKKEGAVVEYTLDEISKHNTASDCWLIIGNSTNGGPKVYDVTKYLDDHPGGTEVLIDVAGQDADEFFEDIGHSNDARLTMKKYYIGEYKIDPALKAEMELKQLQKQKQQNAIPYQFAIAFAIFAIIFALLKMMG